MQSSTSADPSRFVRRETELHSEIQVGKFSGEERSVSWSQTNSNGSCSSSGTSCYHSVVERHAATSRWHQKLVAQSQDLTSEHHLTPSLRSLSLPTSQAHQEQKRWPTESTYHLQSRVFASFCTSHGFEEIVKFDRRRLPSPNHFTLCQQLKTSQALSLSVNVVVVVTIDHGHVHPPQQPPHVYPQQDPSEAAFPMSGSHVQSSQRVTCSIALLSQFEVWAVSLATYITPQIDSNFTRSFLPQCSPKLCKTLAIGTKIDHRAPLFKVNFLV